MQKGHKDQISIPRCITIFKRNKSKPIFKGVKDGQALVEKYMPADAVEHPRENDC